MQIFGNVSISSWVTLRQTWFISGNEQTPRATKLSSAMKHLSRQPVAPLLWGSLSVLWRLLLQLAECEPCLRRGLKDEQLDSWTWWNVEHAVEILEVENWFHGDWEIWMWDLLNKSTVDGTTPKLLFLEVLKSQYCETAVEPMIFYEPGLFAELTCWVNIYDRNNGTSWVFFRSLQV